ncbi:MAG: hypothetical protein IPL58_01105 [Betaproteobacteria bacterium]|uniref:7TM-DISM receptor extracellular domain-containing protein n=1 Tax=Candidatus Proximibacter danicus TaxID=2954365 RepID=A0A9D7JZ58_9PROT|nr:hypothetical protein [Candidatus Proximibacter danicus]
MRRLLIENSWQDQIDIHFLAANGKTLHPGAPSPSPAAISWMLCPRNDRHLLRLRPCLRRFIDRGGYRSQEAARSASYHAWAHPLFGATALSYAMYIGMFVLMNIAYTGHGFAHVWSEHVVIQRWTIPILMVLDSTCGLVFARYFLDTPRNFPRAHKLRGQLARVFLSEVRGGILALYSDDAGGPPLSTPSAER